MDSRSSKSAFSGNFCDIVASQQPCDFIDSFLSRETLDCSEGTVFAFFFENPVVGISGSGNLRKVGDADNLMIFRNLMELAAHDTGCNTADSCIDLIENHGRYIVASTGNVLYCQHDSDISSPEGNFD